MKSYDEITAKWQFHAFSSMVQSRRKFTLALECEQSYLRVKPASRHECLSCYLLVKNLSQV